MDARVSIGWITRAELDAAPELVKTMAVQPPRGPGDIRLVRIGEEGDWIDLQPCGGTHVARTGEIGALRLGRIEKKGRQNRRVVVAFAG
jgi:misacylated tRNA(Ala) deacylase